MRRVALVSALIIITIAAVVVSLIVLPEKSEAEIISAKLNGRADEARSLSFRYRIENKGGDPYPITEGRVSILFPDHYLNVYEMEFEPGQPRVPGIMVQKGREFATVELVFGAKIESATVKRYRNLPPMRGEHYYMTGSMFFGNGAYAYAMDSFIAKGQARHKGEQTVDGVDCYLIDVKRATPDGAEAKVFLDKETVYPRRLEERSFDQTLVTTIYDLELNPNLAEKDFEVDIPKTLQIDPSLCKEESVDYGCTEVGIDEVEILAGFKPVCPEIEGFELAGVFWTNPAAFGPGADNPAYHVYYKECYLVYRNPAGNRQIEICEAREYRGYDESSGAVGLALEGDASSSPCVNEEIKTERGTIYPSSHMDALRAGARKGELKFKVSGDVERRELQAIMSALLE